MVTALLMANGLFAQTNFNAWEFKAGSNGLGTDGGLDFVSNSITMEFWINMAETGLVKSATIMESFGDPHGIYVCVRENSNNANALELRLFVKDNTDPTPQGVTFFVPTSYYIGKWAHVAFVVSKDTEKGYLYVNGEPFGEPVPAKGGYYGNYRKSDNAKRNFNLGGMFWSATNPALVDTKLADVRIWSVARTAEEIKANYNVNLTGTSVENPGLFLNYRFGAKTRPFQNDANAEGSTVNRLWANPNVGNWAELHELETLSAYPQNLAIADETLSWATSAGEWEVSIFKKTDDTKVFADTIATNSIVLNMIDELAVGVEYYAKVRTLNNGVFSGLVTSADFTVEKKGTSIDEAVQDVAFSVIDGNLIVKAEKAQTLNIYTVAGQLVRSVSLVEGENTISGLAKGFYIANNNKVIIK